MVSHHRLRLPVTHPNVLRGRIVIPILIYVQIVHRVICTMPIQMWVFPAQIYGVVPYAPPGRFLQVVAPPVAPLVQLVCLLLRPVPLRVTHVLVGHLRLPKDKVAVPLVRLVLLDNILLLLVMRKVILSVLLVLVFQIVWSHPLVLVQVIVNVPLVLPATIYKVILVLLVLFVVVAFNMKLRLVPLQRIGNVQIVLTRVQLVVL